MEQLLTPLDVQQANTHFHISLGSYEDNDGAKNQNPCASQQREIPSSTELREIYLCEFVEASSELIKSRKSSDPKLDYSNIIVELRALDCLVKERTHGAPNGYYFIPVYDKGSFLIKVNGPEGWSWDPEQVPAVIDHTGCTGNEDINFDSRGSLYLEELWEMSVERDALRKIEAHQM
ncbi:hypothetical protein K7X08_028901 [Anisodus acutangulus]|uniref:NOMO-like N-terminal beta-sandwich domain-containing protein n=1 Tax=Anisodus acutangulus TaxID=402998 RepID=A0A9Q1L3A1_9SOLA|nr:hypothetical protein K7X08_028901 [Anisodus acutangulus]